jgi:hypothetical protein
VTCRSCGATIAKKAIVCYKCGTPTADLAAVSRQPATPPRSGTLLVVLSALLEIGALAAVLWYGRQAHWPVWQLVLAGGAIVAVGTLITIRVSGAARSDRLRRQ